MKLIIAEKPSVAQSIATVVGATKKENGYLSGSDYIVSWCVGHLITPKMPEEYDAIYEKWDLSTLPILPNPFLHTVNPQTKAQYIVLKALMERADITELICATDAAREGELIFRLVYNQVKCTKPFKRLWISSMEDAAIREGMQNLKQGTDYDNLYHAALCRQQADWLVGINLTRLYSGLYHSRLSVGRVQTPTVNLIVERGRAIDTFTPIPYYMLSADFGGFCGALRFEDKEQAEKAKRACEGKNGTITELLKTEKTESAPALYDLTTLQRDSNRLCGYTAQQTLDYMQSLYDKKLATYPRTDSRYLTEDMEQSTYNLITHLLETNIAKGIAYEQDKVSVMRVINNKKVSDHHAIIPTMQLTKENFDNLPTGERNILTLILYRLLSAVYLPHLYSQTKVQIDVEGYAFSLSSKMVLQDGFRLVERACKDVLTPSGSAKEETISLPVLQENQVLKVQALNINENKTKPPVAYTEDTLLLVMETAGKNIEDEELREAMKGGGLGTPATRANIIETIIKTGYVERSGKKLLPTEKGNKFIDLVHPKLKQPDLTAEWEQTLSAIADGASGIAPDTFIQEVSDFLLEFTREQLASQSNQDKAVFSQEKTIVGACPICGMDIVEYPKAFSCTSGRDGCGFVIFRKISEKNISAAVAKQLLTKSKSNLIKGFISKAGKPFDAHLVLDENNKVKFNFGK